MGCTPSDDARSDDQPEMNTDPSINENIISKYESYRNVKLHQVNDKLYIQYSPLIKDPVIKDTFDQYMYRLATMPNASKDSAEEKKKAKEKKKEKKQRKKLKQRKEKKEPN